MSGLANINRRLEKLEQHQNTPQETYDQTVRLILRELNDDELDIMEKCAKLRVKGLTEEEIEKKVGPDQWQEYQKALDHFRSINKNLTAGRVR